MTAWDSHERVDKSSGFCFFSVLFFYKALKKTKTFYLNLQKVVELLTCGRKGLRSAELKVPQLILCSERNKTTRTAKGPRKEETLECFPHIKT